MVYIFDSKLLNRVVILWSNGGNTKTNREWTANASHPLKRGTQPPVTASGGAMTENTGFQHRQDGHQAEERNKASSRPSGSGSHGRPTDAGVVLRRRSDPNAPGSWRIAPLRSRPNTSNVDTKDRIPGRPFSPNVDIKDVKDGTPIQPNVDTKERPASVPFRPFGNNTPKRPAATSTPSNVDIRNDENWSSIPIPQEKAIPTRLRDHDISRHSGPSGPSPEVLKKLREATKRRVADRARARGRDPGAGSVEVNEGVTRSAKTHEQYLERGRSLVKRYQKETGQEHSSLNSLDPLEFTNWFFSLKPTVKPTTWRPYRQSVKAILASIPHDNTEAALALIEADIVEIEMTDQPLPKNQSSSNVEGSRKKLPRKTSALKEKRFPKADFDKVISFLRHFSRSKLAPVLLDWMIAGITTGLRPIEWAATDLEIREDQNAPNGRHVWLYVLNAKSTNGRANGVVRTIDLSSFSDDTLSAIQSMSSQGASWLANGEYDTVQSQVSQLLYSTSQRLFSGRKRVYSLYSLRHQFIANAKSYQKPEEIAAIVGHGVTVTAAENYGKKRSSWGPDEIPEKPSAVADEVATVRQSLEFYENRIKLQEQAGLIRPSKRPAPKE